MLASMAATAVNGLLATGFRRVLRRNGTLSFWPTRSSASVALHVQNGSSFFNINSSLRSKDYIEQSNEMMEFHDGGPPRWFSPLECGCRSTGSPLLLILPGIDGLGLGLMLHHERLGEIFDIWCLNIPLADRTSLSELVMLVGSALRTEHDRAAKRPIYLVGESFGASLALVVAARNPHIDLVLILANPVETVLWKLEMIHEMQNYLNSHLHAVKAQTLILKSGKDLLLSSIIEGERLRSELLRCQIRSFIGNGDPLFLDGNFDLAAAIKRASYYRRGASVDYVSDFLPTSPSEFKMMYESFIRWIDVAVDPVMLSTMGEKVVRGLAGIPSQGPVLLVGNHLMLGMDAIPLVFRFRIEQNIMVRTMAHPLVFKRLKDGKFLDSSLFDVVRITGGVPVSATNLYRLLSFKSHVLLYPGGIREAFHRKGEEYKLIWPVDILQLLLDCDEQMKIPPLKAFIEELTSEAVRLRSDAEGEIGKQFLHYPLVLPKLPGRLYFLFGKPISTKGRKDVLRNKDKAREMYVEVQTEIQKCIAYLKEKREKDPYRNILARLVYQAYHGFDSQVPTFDI